MSPSAAYMRQYTGSALVQIMACRLFDVKPLSEPTLFYCQLGPWEQNLNRWWYIFIQENLTENVVCEMLAILSRGKWVNVEKNHPHEKPLLKCNMPGELARLSHVLDDTRPGPLFVKRQGFFLSRQMSWGVTAVISFFDMIVSLWNLTCASAVISVKAVTFKYLRS